MQSLEWIDDFDPDQASISTLLPSQHAELDDRLVHLITDETRVQNGWCVIYTSRDPSSPFNERSTIEQVLREIQRLVDLYKDEELSITVTRHSLGAVLATLCATNIVINGVNRLEGKPPIPVTGIVFASPQVGNTVFKEIVDRLPDLRVLRITNNPDLVSLYPLLGYADVGVEIRIDTRKSLYMKSPKNASEWHNMEAYLHVVVGAQGIGKPF